jgi:hypothetical protein
MRERRITQIPLPGDSGRIPTGAMQFQDDWPGLFLRGDAAIPLMCCIRYLVENLGKQEDKGVMSCLAHLQALANMIEEHVVVRSDKPG